MNLKEYADHRAANGLSGTSHVAVIKAIRAGRLDGCYKRVGSGYVIDSAAADAAWESRTDPTQGKPNVGRPPAHRGTAQAEGARLEALQTPKQSAPEPRMSHAAVLLMGRAASAQLRAQKDKLEYDEMSGELVRKSEVKAAWQLQISRAKAKLLPLGDQLSDLVANQDPATCKALIDEKIREVLSELARA